VRTHDPVRVPTGTVHEAPAAACRSGCRGLAPAISGPRHGGCGRQPRIKSGYEQPPIIIKAGHIVAPVPPAATVRSPEFVRRRRLLLRGCRVPARTTRSPRTAASTSTSRSRGRFASGSSSLLRLNKTALLVSRRDRRLVVVCLDCYGCVV
jgi:hypothetical protein